MRNREELNILKQELQNEAQESKQTFITTMVTNLSMAIIIFTFGVGSLLSGFYRRPSDKVVEFLEQVALLGIGVVGGRSSMVVSKHGGLGQGGGTITRELFAKNEEEDEPAEES